MKPTEEPTCGADLLTVHAREKFGLPPTWRIYRWQCCPVAVVDTKWYSLTGAECTAVFTRGKRKGHINWDKMDVATRQTVTITVAEQDAFELEWEKRTGKCRVCCGSGKTIASVSVSHGTTYGVCRTCGGTGQPRTGNV